MAPNLPGVKGFPAPFSCPSLAFSCGLRQTYPAALLQGQSVLPATVAPYLFITSLTAAAMPVWVRPYCRSRRLRALETAPTIATGG